MPKKIREMTEQEFRQYVADNKTLKSGDAVLQKLNSDYANRDWDDQQDFILRMMQIQYPALKNLSLNKMREIIYDDLYEDCMQKNWLLPYLASICRRSSQDGPITSIPI